MACHPIPIRIIFRLSAGLPIQNFLKRYTLIARKPHFYNFILLSVSSHSTQQEHC
jgi:hypothetical protein